jgi:Immunity protein 26
MKLPYSEGSVFLVPLRQGGYARGVVARAGAKGKDLLGYFFGPRIESIGAIALDDLNPAGAGLRIRFGDLGLINGAWPILGRIPNWNRAKWPMPEFVRRDPLFRYEARPDRFRTSDRL